MKNSMERLGKILEAKAIKIVDAVEKADPTTPEYKELLLNFDVSMAINMNINNTLNPQPFMPGMMAQPELEPACEEDVAVNEPVEEIN